MAMGLAVLWTMFEGVSCYPPRISKIAKDLQFGREVFENLEYHSMGKQKRKVRRVLLFVC
jgi:hypothetical protein